MNSRKRLTKKVPGSGKRINRKMISLEFHFFSKFEMKHRVFFAYYYSICLEVLFSVNLTFQLTLYRCGAHFFPAIRHCPTSPFTVSWCTMDIKTDVFLMSSAKKKWLKLKKSSVHMENSLEFRLNGRRMKLNVSQTIKIQTFKMRIMHSYMIFIHSFVHSFNHFVSMEVWNSFEFHAASNRKQTWLNTWKVVI